jgi:DNA polymerase-1
MKAKIYDTLLWEYVENPWSRWLALDKIAERKFDYEMINYKDITEKKHLNFSDVDILSASKYSWEDVYITHMLFENQKKNKEMNFSNSSVLDILYDIEIPLIQVLKDIEITWVKIDRDRLKELGVIFENEIIRLSNSIYEEVGDEFNISSPKQVWEILFDRLWLPRGKKTKTGWSVWIEVLENLAREFPICQKIIDYRHYSKLNSTYINWLLDLLDDDDLIHTSYNQAVTSTWRLSSTSPNLQNIPSSSWIASEIRSAFVSRFESGKIMAFDYSQVELRLLAIMSGDENLTNAFKNWFDIHTKTWELIWITDRKIAKAVNFWVVYGISGFWLAKWLNISVSEATNFINKFFNSYPKVKKYLDDTIIFCEKNWYVQTMFWRKRYIKWINDSNKMMKKSSEREAINMPVQWTSADIIKIAMIRVAEFMTSPQPSPQGEGVMILKSKVIMQVHDELVFDVFPWEEKILEGEIIRIMESILENKDVNLKVDFNIWSNWKEAK